MSKETITLPIYGDVNAETDKAVRVSVNYDLDGGDFCLSSWFPKSSCTVDNNAKTITMPLWLYNKNKP